MKKLSPEAETPIFQELNKELGDLPEIDIHDFEQHAFEFLREYDEQKSQQGDQQDTAVTADAEDSADEEAGEPVAAAAGAGSGSSRRGGRRRKGN